ncbi:F-box/kelch-repeat protein skip30 [Orobanche gracilis]
MAALRSSARLWVTLPILPSNIRHLAHFGVVSASGKLFVLGGGSYAVDPLTGDQDGSFATDEVWSYDPVIRRWAHRKPMIVPRAMFACCVLDGKIIVAGGFTTCRKSMSKAEIYDPEKEVWVPIPDLHQTHNSACTGMVIEGRVHVLHKGFSTLATGSDAVGKGKLYVMSHGQIYKQERESNKVIVSASEFRRRIEFAMVGSGDDIYIIGGVIGPDRLNWDIKPTSDVDVLAFGNERSVWRQVTPMTKCRGTVLGCTQLRI